jgi:hypothetical protein
LDVYVQTGKCACWECIASTTDKSDPYICICHTHTINLLVKWPAHRQEKFLPAGSRSQQGIQKAVINTNNALSFVEKHILGLNRIGAFRNGASLYLKECKLNKKKVEMDHTDRTYTV